MVYIFEDGRTIYDAELLQPEDEGQYVSVKILPNIPEVPGKTGYVRADLSTGKPVIEYFDTQEPEPEPELEPERPAPPVHTNTDVIQAVEDLRVDLIIAGVIDNV